jgi:hypothetical protein
MSAPMERSVYALSNDYIYAYSIPDSYHMEYSVPVTSE